MRRTATVAGLLAFAFIVHCLAGIAIGQGTGPGYKPGDQYTFTYSIEALNYSVRVPKTASIPLNILAVDSVGASSYNMTYSYTFKEMDEDIPVDRVMNFTVSLKPVVNESIVEERVNTSTNVLELVFLHNFSTSAFDGNVSGTNHPVLGNYSVKWKPTGLMELGIFQVVLNISQDGVQRPVLSRVILSEAVPGAIPGPAAPLLFVAIIAGSAVMVITVSRRARATGDVAMPARTRVDPRDG